MAKDNAPLKPLRYAVSALGAVLLITTMVVAFIPSLMGEVVTKSGIERETYEWSNDSDLLLRPADSNARPHCAIEYADGGKDQAAALSSSRGVNALVLLKGTIVESNDKGAAKVTCTDTVHAYSGSAMSLAWLPTNPLLILLCGIAFVAPLLPLLGSLNLKGAKVKRR